MWISNSGHRRLAWLSVALLIFLVIPCGCNEEKPLASSPDQNASHADETAVHSRNLLVAVTESQPEKVAALLSLGADTEVVDAYGATPLYLAAYTGDIRSAKLLIAAGASIEGNAEAAGCTPLYEAAASGNMDVAKLLIKNGAKVNARQRRFGYTPLHRAAEEGHLEMVKCLIKYGADVNAKTNNGQTALHRTARWGNLEVLQALLDSGADPGLNDNTGALPWQIASDKGHGAAARLLQGR